MKVLNLYCGIGGNRKLWPKNCQVTAVEINPQIAAVYKKLYPSDNVIIGNAHNYLLDHYEEFDFIWSSPPCPTHSDIRRCGVKAGRYKAQYPDMQLYEEIIFLQTFYKGKWVVENVRSYYKPLIKPFEADRHYFWANFNIGKFKDIDRDLRIHNDIIGSRAVYGFNLVDYEGFDKRKVLRNLVDPKLGRHVFNCAFKVVQEKLV